MQYSYVTVLAYIVLHGTTGMALSAENGHEKRQIFIIR